jgi:hypothetical protein
VGEFFTSFDAAWSAFLERREPLEWFFGDFAEDEGSVAEGWLVEAPAHVKEGAVELQDALAHLDWLTPVPDHFLHVWLAGPGTMGNAYERWADVRPFAAEFRRVNCFHSAVVVEASGAFARLVEESSLDRATFLPHLTIAVTRERHDPVALREVLQARRDVNLGEATVDEVKLVRFPASRTTLFRPWETIRTIRLGPGPSRRFSP